jgi:membrane-associated HD superfamily phosphohydrolase
VDARDRNGLEELVRRIVFSKLAAGQLDDSGLSMSELRVLSTRVVDTLVHMNHHRIKYPWQEKKAEKSRTVAARPRDDYKTSGWDRLKVCQ